MTEKVTRRWRARALAQRVAAGCGAELAELLVVESRAGAGARGIVGVVQSAFACLTSHGQTFTGAGRAHFSGKTVQTQTVSLKKGHNGPSVSQKDSSLLQSVVVWSAASARWL